MKRGRPHGGRAFVWVGGDAVAYHLEMDQREKRRLNWRVWAAGALALLMLVVALQNSQEVGVDVLMIDVSAPLIVVILLSAVVGAIVGYVAPLVRRHRRDERGKL